MSQPTSKRRMIGSAVILIVVFAAIFVGRQGDIEPGWYTVSSDAMGTTVQIKLDAASQEQLQELAEHGFAAVFAIDALLSDYKDDSQLSEANRDAAARPVTIDPDFIAVLEEARRIADASGGAFDVTVGPLIDLWWLAVKDGVPPSDSAIAATLERVDYTALELDGNALRFGKPGLRLDFGAIAKGYAVDKAVAALKEKGVPRAIVDAGGDLFVLGLQPSGNPFRIGIEHPSADTPLCVVAIADRAVTTSGVKRRYFEIGDVRFNHIVDPRTGRPVDEAVSVTVIASTAMLADGLSTAVMVLGREEGLALVDRFPGAEALVVTLSGADSLRVFPSAGFGQYLVE